jgi:oxaloacetate decarboxylase alpha subunit
VGTQAVINVLMGERYKSIAKETEGVLKGEYGATPAPVNSELQAKVLKEGEEPITCRPADLLDAEMDKLTAEFGTLVSEHGIKVAKDEVDDVLIYALFPQVGLKFLKNRGNPDAFEPAPGSEQLAPQPAAAATAATPSAGPETYQVEVNGVTYNVKVSPTGSVTDVAQAAATSTPAAAPAPASVAGETEIVAPLSGNIHAIKVSPGQQVAAGDVVMVLEAMKMETEVRATSLGTVAQILVKEGEAVQVGTPLLSLS